MLSLVFSDLMTISLHFISLSLSETGAVSVYDNRDQLGQLKDAVGTVLTLLEIQI